RITALLGEVKALSSENEKLKNEKAKDSLGDVMNSVVDIKGVKFLAAAVPGVEMNELRNLGDSLKEKLGEGVIVLASDAGGKVNLIAMASDEAMARGVHAGNLIREIAPLVGGGGGGRPNMAQAGGKNPAGISDALKKAAEAALAQIK
ncbi:MAG: alanine--tRNA ligase, partial [Lachnospiraceae bacterium]|nr:alanine--tRNA ligase [Lachnospiraceae bacterium]